MARVFICRDDELNDGELRPIELNGSEAMIVRDATGVFALARRCLHQGADLTEGIVSRGSVLCPQHGWRFLLENGQQDVSPQNCLVTYAVTIENGAIYVDPMPLRRGEEPT